MRDSVVIEHRDTLREVTTVTIDRNEAGDTLRLSRVTERDKVRFAAQLKDRSEKIKVVHDTVFVVKRDTVSTTNRMNETNVRASPVVSALKCIFAIIIAVIGLTIILKFKKFNSLIKTF